MRTARSLIFVVVISLSTPADAAAKDALAELDMSGYSSVDLNDPEAPCAVWLRELGETGGGCWLHYKHVTTHASLLNARTCTSQCSWKLSRSIELCDKVLVNGNAVGVGAKIMQGECAAKEKCPASIRTTCEEECPPCVYCATAADGDGACAPCFQSAKHENFSCVGDSKKSGSTCHSLGCWDEATFGQSHTKAAAMVVEEEKQRLAYEGLKQLGRNQTEHKVTQNPELKRVEAPPAVDGEKTTPHNAVSTSTAETESIATLQASTTSPSPPLTTPEESNLRGISADNKEGHRAIDISDYYGFIGVVCVFFAVTIVRCCLRIRRRNCNGWRPGCCRRTKEKNSGPVTVAVLENKLATICPYPGELSAGTHQKVAQLQQVDAAARDMPDSFAR